MIKLYKQFNSCFIKRKRVDIQRSTDSIVSHIASVTTGHIVFYDFLMKHALHVKKIWVAE